LAAYRGWIMLATILVPAISSPLPLRSVPSSFSFSSSSSSSSHMASHRLSTAGRMARILRPRRSVCVHADGEYGRFGAAEEWGARDPFAGEIETNFGTKVRNADTFHIVKIPKNDLFGLQNEKYTFDKTELSEDDVVLYQNQVPGFDMRDENDREVLVTSFTLDSEENLKELQEMVEHIKKVPGRDGTAPDTKWEIYRDEDGEIEADLLVYTEGTEGFTYDDFVLCGHIDSVDFSDLVMKEEGNEIFHFG